MALVPLLDTLPGRSEGMYFVRTGRLKVTRDGSVVELSAGEDMPEAFDLRREALQPLVALGRVGFRYSSTDEKAKAERVEALEARAVELEAKLAELAEEVRQGIVLAERFGRLREAMASAWDAFSAEVPAPEPEPEPAEPKPKRTKVEK